MSGEGFKLAVIMVVCFMITALTSLGMLALGKADTETLKQVFEGLGFLAAMFGLPAIITAWIVTRGQTSKLTAAPPETGA